MEIKFYKSYWKTAKLLLLSLMFVLITLLFPDPLPPFLYWFTIIFFGLCVVAGLAHLLDRRPQLIINEKGIYERSYNEFINWTSIEDAYTANFNGQKVICLILNENHKTKKSNTVRKGLIKLNKRLGAQEYNIPYGQLDVDENKLLELFRSKLQSDTESTN